MLAAIVLAGCASPYPRVFHIKDVTVPAGDTSPRLADPVSEGYARRFTWEFDSHLDATGYLEWLVPRLTQDGFAVPARRGNAIAVARLDGGDAYRMSVEVSASPPTHVRVTLVVSPD